MLYTKKFSDKSFENPTAEYRGTPFWAWNCRMTTEKIRESVQVLKQMGMGGGHIHCRTGMSIPYLSREFMELAAYAHEEMSREGMLTWLYDEDRWPSGAAGGLVTKDERYRMRYLVFRPVQVPGGEPVKQEQVLHAIRNKNCRLLRRYSIQLVRDCLEGYRFLSDGEEPGDWAEVWEAYQEISDRNPWFNNQTYLNTLDKKSVQQFLTVTYERYREKLGCSFGDSIPAIFTDEPQYAMKTRLGFAGEKKELILPFTDDLEDTFIAAYGHSLLEHLPELFWELPKGKCSVIRYQYHDHVTERFVQAYADTLGDWCREQGIYLTGHMMEEQTLQSQTAVIGEAMRSYRAFGIPGVDILRDQREYSTVKQAQSVAHQYNRCGVLSELYGVTNWDFDFRGHKLQGDWQAALGVTVRVPHLMWTSMEGEAKRDFPASIGSQSPWFREYPVIETYFARIHTAMTSGKPLVKNHI